MQCANISGARIREARKKKGWGQVDLASALSLRFNLEICQSDISEIERQVRGIKDFELDAITHLLDVSPLWLLRGDEKEKQYPIKPKTSSGQIIEQVLPIVD